MSVRVVATATLRRWMTDGTSLWLLHGSGPESFRRAHVPGAICLVGLAQASAAIGTDERVVVYGDDRSCAATRRWQAELLQRGYRDVWWYAAGIAGWREAGGTVEGTSARDAR